MTEQTLAPSGHRCPEREPVRQWDCLQRGDRVEVWSAGSFRYTGSVDDRAADGALIWVIDSATGCRRLLVRDDPLTLYPI